MNNDKRIIDIICDSLLPLSFLFIVIICIVFSFTSHAASSSGNPLPYITSNDNSDLAAFLDQCVAYNSQNTIFRDAYLNNNFFGYSYVENGYTCYAFYVPNSSFDYSFTLNTAYDLYDKSTDGLNFTFNNFSYIKGRTEWSGRYWYFYGATSRDNVVTDTTVRFGNGSSNGLGSYLIPEFSSKNYTLYPEDSEFYDEYKVVFGFGVPEVPLGPDDITNNGNMPDSSDYFEPWSNAPTLDNSTVESSLSSIFDLISWLSSNLFNTMESFANFISDSVYFALQKVINNLKTEIVNMTTAIGDKIDEVKVGIGSIVDNITDTFDYIKDPVDKTAVQNELEGTLLFNLTSIGGSIKNTFIDFFDSIPQPDTLSFTVPYTILSKSDYITIDFSWYPPIRNTILPWIVGFLYAGFGLAVFRSIPSIIHGVSGVLQKGG